MLQHGLSQKSRASPAASAGLTSPDRNAELSSAQWSSPHTNLPFPPPSFGLRLKVLPAPFSLFHSRQLLLLRRPELPYNTMPNFQGILVQPADVN